VSTGYPEDTFVHNVKTVELLSDSLTDTMMDEACMWEDSHRYMFNFNLLDPVQRVGGSRKSLIKVVQTQVPQELQLLGASTFEWCVEVGSMHLPGSSSEDKKKLAALFPYEIQYSKEHWMLAGQNRGHLAVSGAAAGAAGAGAGGAAAEGKKEGGPSCECRVQVDCIPLVCGSLPCPQLRLLGDAATKCLTLSGASRVVVKPQRIQRVNFVAT